MSEAQIMEPFFTFAGHIQKITPSDAQSSEILRSLLTDVFVAATGNSTVDVTTTPLAIKRKRGTTASPAVVKKLLNPRSPAVAAATAAGNSAKRARIMRNK